MGNAVNAGSAANADNDQVPFTFHFSPLAAGLTQTLPQTRAMIYCASVRLNQKGFDIRYVYSLVAGSQHLKCLFSCVLAGGRSGTVSIAVGLIDAVYRR